MKPCDLTPATIAKGMGISEVHLWWLAHHIDRLYKPRRKQLIKGKARPIDPPTPWLKRTLRKLHRFLQKSFPPHRAVHGGAKGRSCVTAANVHKGRPFLIARDVDNCYPSVTTEMEKQTLLCQGFRADTAHILSLVLTRQDIIPHGAPTSSDALNLYLSESDRRLARTMIRRGARYSRTYDDMVVSTRRVETVDALGAVLEIEIARRGLRVSEKKRRHHGLQLPHQVQTVHGLVVNNPRGIGLTLEQQQRALRVGEEYVGAARCVSPESLEPVAYKRQQLFGWINYSRQVRFGPAKHLARLLGQGDRLVGRRLRLNGVTRTKKWWVCSPQRNRTRAIAKSWRDAAVAGPKVVPTP